MLFPLFFKIAVIIVLAQGAEMHMFFELNLAHATPILETVTGGRSLRQGKISQGMYFPREASL